MPLLDRAAERVGVGKGGRGVANVEQTLRGAAATAATLKLKRRLISASYDADVAVAVDVAVLHRAHPAPSLGVASGNEVGVGLRIWQPNNICGDGVTARGRRTAKQNGNRKEATTAIATATATANIKKQSVKLRQI